MLCYKHTITRLLLIIPFLYSTTTYSQDKINVGFLLSPTSSSLIPTFPQEITGGSVKKSDVIDFGCKGRYFFNSILGVESGITLLTFKSAFNAKASADSFYTVDSENTVYQRTIIGSNITETALIRSVNIPIHLVIRSYLTKNITIIGSVGPGIYIPVQKQTHGTGIFSYSGYYPSLGDVRLTYPPDHGFNSNVPVDAHQTIPTNFMNLDVGGELEINYLLDDVHEIFVSAGYCMPLSNTNVQNNNYHISNELGSYYSLVTAGKNKINTISVSIGFQINLKQIPKY